MDENVLKNFIQEKLNTINDERRKQNSMGFMSYWNSFISNFNDLGGKYSDFFSGILNTKMNMAAWNKDKADSYLHSLVSARMEAMENQTKSPLELEMEAQRERVRQSPTDVAFSVTSKNITEIIFLIGILVMLIFYSIVYFIFSRLKANQKKNQIKLSDILKAGKIVQMSLDSEDTKKQKRRRSSKRRSSKKNKKIKQ